MFGDLPDEIFIEIINVLVSENKNVLFILPKVSRHFSSIINKSFAYTMDNNDLCHYVGQIGSINLLQWLLAQGVNIIDTDICTVIARKGHIEMLKLARTIGCRWNYRSCSAAAEFGHLDVLKWLLTNGCTWYCKEAKERAVIGGHIDVIEWVEQYRCDTCSDYSSKCGCLSYRWSRSWNNRWIYNYDLLDIMLDDPFIDPISKPSIAIQQPKNKIYSRKSITTVQQKQTHGTNITHKKYDYHNKIISIPKVQPIQVQYIRRSKKDKYGKYKR